METPVNEVKNAYQIVPELSGTDLEKFLAFEPPNNEYDNKFFDRTKSLFLAAIIEAFEDPQWLMNPGWTKFDTKEESLGQPRPQYSSDLQWVIQSIRNEDNLEKVAREINEGKRGYSSGGPDIVVRAFEIMGRKYPGISFFRGTGFDLNERFTGFDFAPASLKTALHFLETRFTQFNPVLAMITFVDLADLYSHHRLEIRTEGHWWRNSLELHFGDPEAAKRVVIRRFPEERERQARLLELASNKSFVV